MRFAPLLLLLAACPSAAPFEITVTNVGATTTYVQAGDSTGLIIPLAEEWRGQWTPLASSMEALCVPECGAPGPLVSCASGAAELGTLHALLTGDSAHKEFGGDWWWLDTTAGCARRTVLDNPLRATVCHGATAIDANTGAPLDEPDTSGVVEANGGASLDVVDCDDFEFTLDGGGSVLLEIGED